ncbi:hypothetical protein [Flavobacterium defluvii]|uniref:Uncharacterized protein n=1 Tax=Flavobacterium defluvii TaxID=370979 RepID=A0A1M5IUZ0_9FLAO|nr:hypothetical protein [Flavobacterium defluvii]SHG32152.1 hypothetical protein SAMN05443663_102519 [Flavobacterium defluvii]
MAETTGKVQLSYDVSDKWEEVKSTLINEYKYSDVALDIPTSWIYDLPNTTLHHQNKEVSKAIKDIENVCQRHKVTLKKAVAALISEVAYYNEKKHYNE